MECVTVKHQVKIRCFFQIRLHLIVPETSKSNILRGAMLLPSAAPAHLWGPRGTTPQSVRILAVQCPSIEAFETEISHLFQENINSENA